MKNSLNNVKLAPGRYIIAVSSGVDSMALLHLLAGQPGLELVVAHFNHGIRSDSQEDEELARATAKSYGLAFETGHGKLGPKASEDQARQARYDFLETAREKHSAQAIITAHHQDDLIETAIINVLRGSGRKGMSAIKDNSGILRPLINIPKKQVVAYATANKLGWREDSSNLDPKYLRNYIRLRVAPKLTAQQRTELVRNIDKVAKNRVELDNLIATLSRTIINNKNIDRSKFSMLPSELTGELMASWLRIEGLNQFDRKAVQRLSLGLKTARAGTKIPAGKSLTLNIEQASAHFSNR